MSGPAATEPSLRTIYWAVLAALVAARIAFPLAALANEPGSLPGLPYYDYSGLGGDATGFYAAARELIGALGSGRALVAAVLVLAASGFLFGFRRRLASWVLLVGAVATPAAGLAVVITAMHAPGAAVVGWPVLWSLPMLPLRVLGELDPGSAFAVGLSIQLASVAVTVVATALLGERATGRRSLGLGAAALYSFWPLLMGAIAGERGWENGTWTAETGLAMYTEPLSTALVTVALVLVLGRRTPLLAATAGLVFGAAALVKLTNGILAAVVLALLVWRDGPRRALPFALGGLAFAAPLVAYWPRGYIAIEYKKAPAFVNSVREAYENWAHSLLFSPRTLLVLVPVAILGYLAVRSAFAALILCLPVVANAAIYTFYSHTAQHPRFLAVSLPAVAALWAGGAWWLVFGIRKDRRGGREAASMIAP